MSSRITVYYDFASTLCFVAHQMMKRMASELDDLELELLWRPLDLTLLASWRRGDEIKGPGRANVERVIQELEVATEVPDYWMDSRPAHALIVALEGQAGEAAWRDRIFESVYRDRNWLDQGSWLAELADEFGVDRLELSSARAFDRIEFRTLEAKERQVSGVPSFLLGEWPFSGIQELETMRSIFSRYVRRNVEIH